MKFSNLPYATVIMLTTYCAEHQQDEPYLVMGFIVNQDKYTPYKRKMLLDYIWDRGFEDNLCLKI